MYDKVFIFCLFYLFFSNLPIFDQWFIEGLTCIAKCSIFSLFSIFFYSMKLTCKLRRQPSKTFKHQIDNFRKQSMLSIHAWQWLSLKVKFISFWAVSVFWVKELFDRWYKCWEKGVCRTQGDVKFGMFKEVVALSVASSVSPSFSTSYLSDHHTSTHAESLSVSIDLPTFNSTFPSLALSVFVPGISTLVLRHEVQLLVSYQTLPEYYSESWLVVFLLLVDTLKLSLPLPFCVRAHSHCNSLSHTYKNVSIFCFSESSQGGEERGCREGRWHRGKMLSRSFFFFVC